MDEPSHMIHEKIMKQVTSKSGNTIFRKKRIGDLVAIRIDDKVTFGYTLCHKNDRYNFGEDGSHIPNMGITRAKSRAIKWKNLEVIEIPPSIEKHVNKFMQRCKKYYKDLNIPTIRTMTVMYPQDRHQGFARH